MPRGSNRLRVERLVGLFSSPARPRGRACSAAPPAERLSPAHPEALVRQLLLSAPVPEIGWRCGSTLHVVVDVRVRAWRARFRTPMSRSRPNRRLGHRGYFNRHLPASHGVLFMSSSRRALRGLLLLRWQNIWDVRKRTCRPKATSIPPWRLPLSPQRVTRASRAYTLSSSSKVTGLTALPRTGRG